MKRFWSIVLFLAVGLLVAVIVVSLWGPAPPRPITPLGIRFVSLAHGMTGMPAGECIVSNSNDRTICFWAAAAQVRSGGLWPDKLVLPPVRYTELAAKRTVHLTFVYPRDAVAWRLPIFWFMQPPLKETVDEIMQQNISALLARRPLPGVGFTRGITQVWTNYSIVITNSEAQQSAPPEPQPRASVPDVAD